jgi:hypothetical protein
VHGVCEYNLELSNSIVNDESTAYGRRTDELAK